MIDKAIVLNLSRYRYRKNTMRGALRMLGWDDERITFWLSKDGIHYGGDDNPPLTANVALAAIGDGFRFFKKLFYNRDGTPKQHLTSDLQLTAQSWNYCRVLRHIIETGETCLIIHDDLVPRAEYRELCLLVKELQHEGPFKFLQYQWFMTEPMIAHYGYPRVQMTLVPGVSKGILGAGDKIWIVSPEGARWLLEITEEYYNNFCETPIENTTGASVEYIFSRYIGKSVPEGVYSLIGHRNATGLGTHKTHRYLFEMDHDSAIMRYDGSGFIHDTKDTGYIPDISWYYYDECLPKLKECLQCN